MKITPSLKKKYSEFIDGLQLESIYLIHAKSDYNYKENPLEPTWEIKVNQTAHKEDLGDKKYRAIQNWDVLVQKVNEEKQLLRFTFSFAVSLTSEIEITKDLFEIYINNNLNLNTWPYARELINNMTARMNIPPLTLPYFKSFTMEKDQK